MAENLGTGVSFVSDPQGYNYDTIVFQKGKPPLDTEINLLQQIQNGQARRKLASLPSGWLSFRPFYTSPLLKNRFYTQDPSNAIPEYALVNGMVIHVTNTKTSKTNANLIELPAAPTTASQVNGVFLEVWRALLSPRSQSNKPAPVTAIDSLLSISAIDQNRAWAVGENGLIISTENGGDTWNIQLIDTKYQLNSVYFVNSLIGWVAGNNGIIARSSSGGRNWTIISSGTTENLNSIFAVSQSTVWAVGDSGIILKTTNGINWSAQNSGVTVNLRSVYFLDTQNGWAVGDSGTILRTNDGGAHWTSQTSGVTSQLNNVYFYNLNRGFAVGKNGVILTTDTGGSVWVSKAIPGNTTEYTDVTMTPSLDEYVDGEDVSSQADGTNKVFTVLNKPITKGDGNGTVTNLPVDVVVKVNDETVLIDSVDGARGQIVLNTAPAHCSHVKVYYWYKISSGIFRGKVWVTGKLGTVLVSDNLGESWTIQNPQSSYDINSIYMVSQYKGWIAGQFSIIRHTTDGGNTWIAQTSNISPRIVERVYNEGNTDTAIFLNDDAIHPDTGIETTKRVQIQYRIRVISDVDPFNFPEAGLGSQAVLSMGPNASGQFVFENMGPTTGDYGLWRARCPNTVDGYSYAIPMFFVARRNSSAWDVFSNANGSSTNTAIRPDLLTSDDVVPSDIQDVRRQIIIPSTTELLNQNFEALLDNRLETRFYRETGGGDRYGTQILQIDRIGAGTGGTVLEVPLSWVAGGLSSQVVQNTFTYPLKADASVVPISYSPDESLDYGLYHQNPAYYRAVYISNNPVYNGKPVPGDFTGFGTNLFSFTFKSYANTKAQDTELSEYGFQADWIRTDTTAALTRVPSDPKLVKNYHTTDVNKQAIYYQGVFEHETSGRIIYQWDSGLSGYVNYALAYPINSSDSSLTRCSSVELHYFLRADSSNIIDSTTLSINTTNFSGFSIGTVLKLNNVTSGFSYKIRNVSTTNPMIITTETGYDYVPGSIYEIVGMVKTNPGNTNTKNGATVNFKRAEKKLSMFCVSDILQQTNITVTVPIEFNLSNSSLAGLSGKIIGVSSMERKPINREDLGPETGIILPFCWVNQAGLGDKIYPISIKEWNPGAIYITIYDWNGNFYNPGTNVSVKLQVLVHQDNLLYTDINSGLLIGYYYKPYQSESELPSSLTIKMIDKPAEIIISNLGTGGGFFPKEPYDNPLINIPVNDPNIKNDNMFYNIEPMKFFNFSVDGGLVKLPAYVSGSMEGEFTLTAPLSDLQARSFYSVCSKEFIFRTEALQMAAPRKIFSSMLGKISSSSDNRFMKGEYVMVVFSRNEFLNTDNYTGYRANDKCAIAIYRLPNRPIARV